MPNLKLLAALVAALSLSLTAAFAEAAGELVVTGEGRVAAVPDMATVSLGVAREARDATAAMRAASEAAAAVIARLEDAGVAKTDIQTTRIGLDPAYARQTDNGPPRITGYIASNDLVVRIRDLDALGGVLDQVVVDGANNFRGLSFGIAEPGALEDEARRAAVADAMARAGTLAEAAGVTLGPVLRISEGGGFSPPQPFARDMMMAEAAIPVAAGEIEIGAQVTIVYRLGE